MPKGNLFFTARAKECAPPLWTSQSARERGANAAYPVALASFIDGLSNNGVVAECCDATRESDLQIIINDTCGN